MEGDEEAVLALLKAGAYSSGSLEKDDRTPLHAAAQAGRYVNLVRLSRVELIVEERPRSSVNLCIYRS